MNRRPNIILLMTDQQRWNALGSVNPAIKTPNLDRLAANGIRYENAVCNTAICIPSRYSMLTGLYSSQCGVRNNGDMIADDANLPHDLLPEALRKSGYQTAGFGKTHYYLGNEQNTGIPINYSRRGFEHRAAEFEEHLYDPDTHSYHSDGGQLNDGMPEVKRQWDEEADGCSKLYKHKLENDLMFETLNGYIGATHPVPEKYERDGWSCRKALQFLDEDRDPERPLFLYLSLNYPHAALSVPSDYEKRYNINDIELPPDDVIAPIMEGFDRNLRSHFDWAKLPAEKKKETYLRYYALCTYADELLGRVIDKLDAQGELENSIILYVSDHGDMLGERGCRFSKVTLYESSIRVPMIVSGSLVPENLRGTVDPRPAEMIDVYPTLLQAAEIDPPDGLPGASLLNAPCRLGTFSEFHGLGYDDIQWAPGYCWRKGGWKLIIALDGDISDAPTRVDSSIVELYDLKNDPYEINNLAANPAHAARREGMMRELLMHIACAWAKYPRRASLTSLTKEGVKNFSTGQILTRTTQSIA